MFSNAGKICLGALAASVLGLCVALPAHAARINNPVAVFSGIDKITGNITTFDVYINETVQFGALQVTPRVCFSRDETEKPKTTTFVEVEEITLDRNIQRIFTGWMFADSPGLNAVEHAVYDIWLKDCKLTSDIPAPAGLTLPQIPDPVVTDDSIASQIQRSNAEVPLEDNGGLAPVTPSDQLLEELPILDLSN